MPSTTRYKRGDIVLVPFPFTDLTSSKRRPALVVSPDRFNSQAQDLVVAAITSQLSSEYAVGIDQTDCIDGMLPRPSVVRLAKVFTIHSTLVIRKLCGIREEKLASVLTELRRFFSQSRQVVMRKDYGLSAKKRPRAATMAVPRSGA